MPKTKVVVGGGNFLSLLAVAFIVLKLCGVINWSWWWVLSPLWGGFALGAAIVLLVFLGALLVAVVSMFRKK